MQPLRFVPIVKRAIWGGTRLHSLLGKDAAGWTDAAESWELCDLGGDVSIVQGGPFAGISLRQLMSEHPTPLLGRHAGCSRFPIMVKFLDAQQQLSVQVHPRQPTRGSDGVLQPGKAEAWVVLAADEGSRIFAGLQQGVTESQLREAIAGNDVAACLHSFQPRVGDSIFLEPGTVHALGGGILVAEIQRPSNITYRLHDWNRVDAAGNPRELHLEAAIRNSDFSKGPVNPERFSSETGATKQLVNSPYFRIDRHDGPSERQFPEDGRCRVLVMISGDARLLMGESPTERLKTGETLVLPAEREVLTVEIPAGATMLDSYLPKDFEEF